MKKTLIKLILTISVMVGFVYGVIIPVAHSGYAEKYRRTDTALFGTVLAPTSDTINTGTPPKRRDSLYSRLRSPSMDNSPVISSPRWNTNIKTSPACSQQTSALQCMQCAIYWEARSESIKAQFLVGATILNRVRSQTYPNTICGVVWQKRQFSFTQDGKSDYMKNSTSIVQTLDTAKDILRNDDYGTGSIDILTSNTAMYYHDISIKKPHWAKKMKLYAQTKSFRFYEK